MSAGPGSDLFSASRVANVYVAMRSSPTTFELAGRHPRTQAWALLSSDSERERGFLPHARLRPAFWFLILSPRIIPFSQFEATQIFLFSRIFHLSLQSMV